MTRDLPQLQSGLAAAANGVEHPESGDMLGDIMDAKSEGRQAAAARLAAKVSASVASLGSPINEPRKVLRPRESEARVP